MLAVRVAVTVTIKARTVTVKGPRGTLTRNFKKVPIDLKARFQPRSRGWA
jgi:ribosomal protein L6P/L9E